MKKVSLKATRPEVGSRKAEEPHAGHGDLLDHHVPHDDSDEMRVKPAGYGMPIILLSFIYSLSLVRGRLST
ncbi:MAG TPA: hypothetical protein VMV04_05125 [Thermodesulfobacteriota bacterium]|nr:hypothetical protein [Thermodesulfobacteriota bacterium]